MPHLHLFLFAAKGRTNVELREQFILAQGISQSLTGFIAKSPSGSVYSGSSTYSGTASLSGRSASSASGHVGKVRLSTDHFSLMIFFFYNFCLCLLYFLSSNNNNNNNTSTLSIIWKLNILSMDVIFIQEVIYGTCATYASKIISSVFCRIIQTNLILANTTQVLSVNLLISTSSLLFEK